jgi:hypothetical protein
MKDIIKCYDKYNQLLKEGDYVDVQKDGVHQIYKKDDGQLYFAPYGEEDRVSAYFSNDIAKCDKDGCWINNDRYEDIVIEPAQSPIGGFAPGSYWCNCVTCKEKFMGDKRAVQCEPCAIEMVNIKVKINEQGGIESVKEDPLEEAAERNHNEQKLNTYTPYSFNDAFKDGAKWQAERMYSEEEVLDLLYKRDLYLLNRDEEVELESPDEWFEQFKKK